MASLTVTRETKDPGQVGVGDWNQPFWWLLQCFLVKLSLCPRLTHFNLPSLMASPEMGKVSSSFVI